MFHEVADWDFVQYMMIFASFYFVLVLNSLDRLNAVGFEIFVIV